MRRATTFTLAFLLAIVPLTVAALVATIVTHDAGSPTPDTSSSDPPIAVESVNDVLAQWATDTYGTQNHPEPEPEAEPMHTPVINPTPDVRASLTSVECAGEARAPDSGDLGHWADRWYVAHDWTEPGQLIASLSIGDVIEIDGERLRVTGVIERLKTVDAPSVRDSFKTETLLQTCADDDTNFFAVCEHAQQ